MRIFILIAMMAFFLGMKAQIKNMPYRNGFENNAQRAEFRSVRTGDSSTSGWSYHSTPANYASHDYPVGGSSTDTVSDWLFSPPIRVTNGAVLSFRYYVYGITGNATPADEFSIWYGKRNTNPKNGTYMRLFDLTNKISSTINDWKDTSGILLPFTADTGYVVFRYRATNNWFTIGVDSVVVKIPGLSTSTVHHEANVKVFPNPFDDQLRIDSETEVRDVKVIAVDGKTVYQSDQWNPDKFINTELWEAGVYMLEVKTVTGSFHHLVVKDR
jgi:hypothetical protein